MKVFMLGWEFPPFISGGLGTACYGLTKALDRLGTGIIFVMPKAKPTEYSTHLKMLCAQGAWQRTVTTFTNVKFRTITSELRPYESAASAEQEEMLTDTLKRRTTGCTYPESTDVLKQIDYGGDMYTAVHRYARQAARIAAVDGFDIIHAHDWMTYPAGTAAAQASGRPLVVHVHSTEFDRSGEHVNQMIYDIEREGMHAAAKVIAVSNYTRNVIISRYGVPPDKVEVVYNGVETDSTPGTAYSQRLPEKTDKIVLFLGRITMQKGPEYFLGAAKKVLEKIDNVKFVMAGDGDMLYRTIELAAQLGIGHKVLFTRFLRGDEVRRMYQTADLYVMPSVSEPFGIAALEALQHDVPVLVSKQSGVAELLTHVLKVDFWDIHQMANKIIAVLRHPPLAKMLQENGRRETHRFRWEDSAARLIEIYEQTLALTS